MLDTVTRIVDLHLEETCLLPSPSEFKKSCPLKPEQALFVGESRVAIQNIIHGQDNRLLVVVGPCSIHDVVAGKEYAHALAAFSKKVEDKMLIAMRAYFEKPRTSIGWKGLVMDPMLDGSFNIIEGLQQARNFLSYLVDLQLPTATEVLDPITPQYIADYVSWGAIGARTTESQTHRQLASGLSMPLGFKNSTDGRVEHAVHAIKAANQKQTFFGIDAQGKAAAFITSGNPHCHVVLRGGHTGPNYSENDVRAASNLLEEHGLNDKVMVDCSHANSGKKPHQQPKVLEEVLRQVKRATSPIMGIMLESNLYAGNQPFATPKDKLMYGVSITDSCLGWEETEAVLWEAYQTL